MIIVMSGYGHFQVNTPAGPGADNRKPNSTGMDFVIKCVSLIVKCLYMHIGVVDKRKHYESPAVVSRWTPTALEMMGYATVVGNEIKSVPPTSMRDRPVVAPEMRGFIHGALVNALPRGPNSDQTLSSSSCQTTANSGIYTAATKEEVCKPSFCAITSNQLNNTPETFEYTTSLMAVAKVLTPGAPPPDDAAIPEDEDMRKLLVKVNANLKRTEKITEPRVPAYFLVFPHFFVGVHAGLLNRVGAIDYDIPPALLGYLEWLHIIVKNFFGMMDVKVVESYHRLAQGHMSRVVGFAAWIEGIRRMAEGKDAVQTSTNLALSLQFNALPLPMIPYILDTFLPRCIHTSSLVVSSMLIELLHVPVIEREELEHFFNTPQPPSQAEVVHYDTFNKIRVFITECIRKQRFCPDNDEAPFDSSSNTSPYITGDVVGERNDTWLLLMRDWKRAVDDAEAVLKKVGNALRDKYGDEAYLQVHMNREACIWVNALRNCRDKYKPCSTVFCGQGVYKSRQHFIKLGLHTHMPGMQNAVPREKMPYLRTVVLHGGQGGDKAGIAVNVWDLLVQASVMRGARLGVHMNNEVASSIIRFALDMAPVSCTPGNALIRSTFNMVSGKNEELLLKRDRNIHHFLRGDLHDFATTGRLSILPVLPDTNFLPEDYLHMASIKPLADFYKCKTIYEVPASAIKVRLYFIACARSADTRLS